MNRKRLREMIYSELFEVLKENASPKNEMFIVNQLNSRSIDNFKKHVIKKGEVKGTYAKRPVVLKTNGSKDIGDWTVTFLQTKKTAPFIDTVANLVIEDKKKDDDEETLLLGKKIKESTESWEKALKQIAKDRQLAMLSKKDKETLLKIAKLLKKEKEKK